MYSHLNEDHLQRVIIAKRDRFNPAPTTIVFPELEGFIGQDIFDNKTNQKYIIAGFYKHWVDGWCIVAKLQRYEWDGMFIPVNVIWENISSQILTADDEMHKAFSFINA